MSQHYYSQQPEARHDRRSIDTELRGKRLRFTSDAGVFSKGDIDHGSRVLIEAMEIPEDAKVLDVGCGYGPIGISAAYLASKGHVTMIDINSRAVELARENAQHNGIRNVTVMESDVLSVVEGQTFDVILTNPPIRAGKAVVHAIFEQAYEHLNEGGCLWVVIQKKQGCAVGGCQAGEYVSGGRRSGERQGL